MPRDSAHATSLSYELQLVNALMAPLGRKPGSYGGPLDDVLEHMIFEKTVQTLIIIDQINSDLENVVNQLTMKIDIIEVQKFMYDRDVIFKFTPFQEEIRSLSEECAKAGRQARHAAMLWR